MTNQKHLQVWINLRAFLIHLLVTTVMLLVMLGFTLLMRIVIASFELSDITVRILDYANIVVITTFVVQFVIVIIRTTWGLLAGHPKSEKSEQR